MCNDSTTSNEEDGIAMLANLTAALAIGVILLGYIAIEKPIFIETMLVLLL